MWLVSNAWKLLCQILYAYLADNYPVLWFSPKLLYTYEIGATPNFKIDFCSSPLSLCYIDIAMKINEFHSSFADCESHNEQMFYMIPSICNNNNQVYLRWKVGSCRKFSARRAYQITVAPHIMVSDRDWKNQSQQQSYRTNDDLLFIAAFGETEYCHDLL